MRKTMQREVTHTTVKVAKMVQDENGMPKAEALPDVTLIGNVSLEKAQKEVNKMDQYKGHAVTVFGVNADTQVYEMSVEDFMKHATLKVDAPEEQQATAE